MFFGVTTTAPRVEVSIFSHFLLVGEKGGKSMNSRSVQLPRNWDVKLDTHAIFAWEEMAFFVKYMITNFTIYSGFKFPDKLTSD